MKMSLVGSFNLADGYLGASEALARRGVEMSFVPAARYRSDEKKTHVDKVLSDLREQDSDVVLWWRAETFGPNEFMFMRRMFPDKQFIMFSWDDPHQFEIASNFLIYKSQNFDVVFTCCEGSIEDYVTFGAKKVVYCPPGYDPSIHYPEESPEHICDISLVCTNLYDGNALTQHLHVSRKSLLDALRNQASDLDIRLYGPEGFKEQYPAFYSGWAKFEESRKIFRNSRINICTHIRPDGFKYINERVCQIMGSGGLMLVDGVNGMDTIFEMGQEYVLMNLMSPESFVCQVRDILENYSSYQHIRERALIKAHSMLTWDHWAETVLANI